MKCKHTNCLHTRAARIEYAPGVESSQLDTNAKTGEPIRSVLVDVRICECGAWLSLGHSPEPTEQVAVEVRAAEIAADWTDVCHTSLSASLSEVATQPEVVGWVLHLNDVDLEECNGTGVQSGWLAAEIHFAAAILDEVKP